MINIFSFLDPIFSAQDKKLGVEETLILKSYVKNIHTLLDYGCGSGICGKKIADFYRMDINGVDLVDNRLVNIKFRKITDGKALFPEKSFDAVLLSFVLHHTTHAEKIIRDSKRLAKHKIFVFEDTPEGLSDKVKTELHGALFRWFFGLKDGFKFRNRKKWLDLFKDQSLTIDAVKDFTVGNPFHSPKRTLFVLSVAK